MIVQGVESFLRAHRNVVLATIGRDGIPHQAPVWFLWEDGAFLISTSTATVKWRNLLSDPRCSAVVDDPDGAYLAASGSAELIRGDVYADTLRLVQKYKTPKDIDAYIEEIYRERTRVLIRLRPERIHSYNVEKS
jgi:PPOX class probable F420-dependent enzyme